MKSIDDILAGSERYKGAYPGAWHLDGRPGIVEGSTAYSVATMGATIVKLYYTDRHEPGGRTTAQVLADAKANAAARILLVGVVERLLEALGDHFCFDDEGDNRGAWQHGSEIRGAADEAKAALATVNQMLKGE